MSSSSSTAHNTRQRIEVYVLKLKDGKYYVGESTNADSRIKAHFNGNGSAWTKRYGPVKVVERIQNCDAFEENNITKQYMLKYGIDNVRGGAYVQTQLDEAQKAAIIAEQRSVTGGCFRCGSSTHWAANCNAFHQNKRKHEKKSDDAMFIHMVIILSIFVFIMVTLLMN